MSVLLNKLNLFIVGMPKCGTTSLYNSLRQHPDIFMSAFKEPHYFGKDLTRLNNLYFQKEEEYLKLFTTKQKISIIGETSPYYLFSHSAPQEIIKFNPSSKIIILLRNPTDLVYSLYLQYLYSGNENELNFSKSLELEENRKKGENLPPNIDLVEKIFYKTYIFKMPGQIKRYLKIFGESAVKILLLEDLIQDMEGTFKEILLFLEVDSNFKPDFELKNPYKTFRNKFIRNWIKKLSPKFGELRNKFTTKPLGVMKYIENLNTKYPQKEPLDPVIKLKLDKDFYPVIKELEIIINRNLSTWYKNN